MIFVEVNDVRHISRRPECLPVLLASGVIELCGQAGRKNDIEIVGNELFVLHKGGAWPIEPPRPWPTLSAIADALAPFLAHEASDPGHQQIVATDT